ncbi:S-ribosylhomocysteine lyase [Angelakisella massiliensis]|uniref:S-ribosylhomocysteine lyase n=1 Tax=Angelakisella massiliensis TaxID=1871018 RepID=UPI0008F87DA7|nr:S-ribosylhomocysteine lyase [Angelakisella massiliensis]
MKQIASFCIDHDILMPGMYVSRVDGDVITYDIRMVRPNCGVYLENGAMHTVEHLFATYVRNSPETDAIVYVGPMGCRTGFYFLTRDSISRQRALDLVRETMDFIAGYEGAIPGAQCSAECGNYLEHDLPGARKIAENMKQVLKNWRVEDMIYPVKK